MEKNEVYDYLANIYLDRQPKTPAHKRKYLSLKYAFILIIILSAALFLFILLRYQVKRIKPARQSIQVSTGNQPIRIKYNFLGTSLKKESSSLDFSNLDLSGFSRLEFQARHIRSYGALNLRIEISNALKEISVYYLVAVTDKWKDYSVNLSNFPEITRWDTIRGISFIIEEWNTDNKEDQVFIDDIRFIR